MPNQKILLPYNFTSNDRKALEFVVRTFANQKDVEVTLFNVYTPVPEIEMRGSPIMRKMASSIQHLIKKVYEQEDALKAVKQELSQNGFSGHQVYHIFKPRQKDVALEIIDLCLNGQFNVVVINHKQSKITRFFTANVFTKVVTALKDTTVCTVT
ncbi:MAG: universal stress protein [Deltaproteobacteria bacterium]|nr:universal stress protein [Deltaproteobacteria bacterium]